MDHRRVWTRRNVGGVLAAGFLAAGLRPAAATPPCGSKPEDIVGLVLEGSGAPAGTVVTFGQAFRPGDLPWDGILAARLADGSAVAAQADVKTRHSDGSARFAVVSLAAPALRRGQRVGVLLTRGQTAGAGSTIDFVAALEGRTAVLEIFPAGAGAPWQGDLVATARLSSQAADAVWQAGPLAAQRRLILPIPSDAVGGAAGLRLVADIAIRSDGSLWVATWLRNDAAMQAQGGDAEYGLRLRLDGHEVLRTGGFRQFQYQGFGRTRAITRDGRRHTPPHVRLDLRYLAEAAAVLDYDHDLTVEPQTLTRFAEAMAAPAWEMPLSPRGLVKYMPTGGGRPDIGPTTGPQAVWLVSGDARAAAFVLGQAEAAGAVPWHFWDAANRTWLNTDNYPRLWTDSRGGRGRPGDPASGTITQPVSRDTGWGPDRAHQPDLSSIPYLLTGQRWLLDNLQAQAAANIMGSWPAPRMNAQGLLVNSSQVRASAWGLRQLENAAWLSPDDSVEQTYFRKISDQNWNWLIAQIPAWTSVQGEAHGWLPGAYGNHGAIAPWQQDYLASTVVLAVARGNEKARDFLKWQSNFLLGRFRNAERGFRPELGTAYNLIVSDSKTQDPLQGDVFKTWAEMDRHSVIRNVIPKKPWESTNYNQLALATLAGIYNVLGDPAALAIFNELQRRKIPGSRPEDYRRMPTFSVVPRGISRGRASATRCERASR